MLVLVLTTALSWDLFQNSLHSAFAPMPNVPIMPVQEQPHYWHQENGRRRLMPLDILTDEKGQNAPCPPNTRPIFNSPGTNHSANYKIPLVIHQTCKSRCVTDEFYALAQQWKDLGIPYYFHDDAAIDRLVLAGHEQFPLLRLIWDHCITRPVVKTDLWRLLLLYEYGGIYTDMDTQPVTFQPMRNIRPDDEMYTVTDGIGLPSFHFMASMPQHPIPFLTLHQALENMLFIGDTGSYNPAKTTGKVCRLSPSYASTGSSLVANNKYILFYRSWSLEDRYGSVCSKAR